MRVIKRVKERGSEAEREIKTEREKEGGRRAREARE